MDSAPQDLNRPPVTARPHPLACYGAAVLASALALAASLALHALIDRTPTAFFFAAVAVSAWYGGFGPGLLATVLSVLAVDYLVLPPRSTFKLDDPRDLVTLFIFGAAAALISLLQGRLRQAQQRAEAAHAAADAATQAERAQREGWQTTLASIGDGVITSDASGRVTFLNAVAEVLTGWSLAEAQGRAVDEVLVIINAQTRAPVEHPLARATRDRVVDGLADHTLLIARSGTERAIDASAAPITDEQGKIIGMVLVVRDVSAARAAEQANARPAAIVASSDDAIIGKTLDGTITSWNAAAERLYGYTADEVIGRSIALVIPPDRSDELPSATGPRLERGERIEHLETIRRRKDGTTVDVSVIISPIRAADGTIIGSSSSAHDITARKQAEAALRQSEARFRAVWESAADAMVLSDPHGSVLAVNPAYLRLFGFPPDQVVGQSFALIFPLGQQSSAQDAYQTVFQAAELTPRFETVVQRADGSTTTVEAHYDFVVRDGQRVGIVSMLRDVADRKALEQLQQEFIAMVGHDLRNPLTAIKMRAELLRRRGAYDERDISAILNQVEQQDRLVQDLLEVSQLGAGGLQLERTVFNLVDEARACAEQAQTQTEVHSVRVEASQTVIAGSRDRHRLGRVFANLLSNAIKYSPDGGEILVRVEDRGQDARVTIQDQGQGVPAAALSKLFDRFYRVDASGERASGVGLGLYITRQLVEAHGGRIWAESDGPGQGSAVTFTLPLSLP